MGNKVTKVFVEPVGRKFSRPLLLDERVARHLIRQGKVRLVEDQQAAMETRQRAVIERAPEPPPLVVETKAGSVGPGEPSSESPVPEPEIPSEPEVTEIPETPSEPEDEPELGEEEVEVEEIVIGIEEDEQEVPQSKSRRRAAAAEEGARKPRRRA